MGEHAASGEGRQRRRRVRRRQRGDRLRRKSIAVKRFWRLEPEPGMGEQRRQRLFIDLARQGAGAVLDRAAGPNAPS